MTAPLNLADRPSAAGQVAVGVAYSIIPSDDASTPYGWTIMTTSGGINPLYWSFKDFERGRLPREAGLRAVLGAARAELIRRGVWPDACPTLD